MRRIQSCSLTETAFAVFTMFLLLTLSAAVQPAQAQNYKFKVLHTFHGKDGANPTGQFVRDADGNLYGTTANGGTGTCRTGGGCGTVFKMSASGKILWSYGFKNYLDGYAPVAGVYRDAAGNLYGTTSNGGLFVCPEAGFGCGTVFGFDSAGNKILAYQFDGSSGALPESLLVGDAAGNLYGTTNQGGSFPHGGTLFKVSPAGKEKVLFRYSTMPGPGMILRDNSLYGVTDGGGIYSEGTLFMSDAQGKQTVLYDFNGGTDGGGPYTVLATDSAGNFYGTTRLGGNNCGINSCGAVFEVSPNGGKWTGKTLYVFCQLSNCKDGEFPQPGPLVLDAAGNLYGVTVIGGEYQNCNGDACGVVFKIDPSGKETVLHSFTGGIDGAYPVNGLTIDAAGNLYGAAAQGGDLKCVTGGMGCGVVFEIIP